MKEPTAKHFKTLLLSAMDFTGYNFPEPKTDQERVEIAAKILRNELGFMLEQGHSMQRVCKEWLQGLASACTIMFYNNDIVSWWEERTGGRLNPNDEPNACDLYWEKAAASLANMITRAEQGYKIGVDI